MAAGDQQIDQLKKALFQEELEKQHLLAERVDQLTAELEEERARQRQDPFVEEVVDRVAEVMPEKLGPSITETLKVQIRESRDEVVEALYPILGRLIRKYVRQEIQELSEKVDRRLEDAFSLEKIWEYVRVKWLGMSPSALILREAEPPEVQEIFVIEKDSGLLIGSYSRDETVDQDLIAGMLTAIKSFLEDAFSKKAEEVETIQYEHFKIQLKSYPRFYIAVVMKGILTAEYQKRVDMLIEQFVERASVNRMKGFQEGDDWFSEILKSIIESHDL